VQDETRCGRGREAKGEGEGKGEDEGVLKMDTTRLASKVDRPGHLRERRGDPGDGVPRLEGLRT